MYNTTKTLYTVLPMPCVKTVWHEKSWFSIMKYHDIIIFDDNGPWSLIMENHDPSVALDAISPSPWPNDDPFGDVSWLIFDYQNNIKQWLW